MGSRRKGRGGGGGVAVRVGEMRGEDHRGPGNVGVSE